MSKCSVKTHIEPLAIAVNVAQAADTRCDHVVLILGNLFCVYTEVREHDRTSPDAIAKDASHPVVTILDSIEKRWLKCDQDLYLACFWLNPYINVNLRNDDALPIAVLFGIVKRLYSRVFPDDRDHSKDLIQDAYEYHTRERIFSDEKWPLETLKAVLKDQVRRGLNQFLYIN